MKRSHSERIPDPGDKEDVKRVRHGDVLGRTAAPLYAAFGSGMMLSYA